MNRLTVGVVAAGVLAGLVVAVASVAAGTPICGSAGPADACFDLVRTLSVRTGLVAGAMTVLMLLTVVGLLRMAAQDDELRAARADEARAKGALRLLPE